MNAAGVCAATVVVLTFAILVCERVVTMIMFECDYIVWWLYNYFNSFFCVSSMSVQNSSAERRLILIARQRITVSLDASSVS